MCNPFVGNFRPLNQMPGGPDPEAVLRHCARLISNGVGDPESRQPVSWRIGWNFRETRFRSLSGTWTGQAKHCSDEFILSDLSRININIMQEILSIQYQVGDTYRSSFFLIKWRWQKKSISLGTCLTSCSSKFFSVVCFHEFLHACMKAGASACKISNIAKVMQQWSDTGVCFQWSMMAMIFFWDFYPTAALSLGRSVWLAKGMILLKFPFQSNLSINTKIWALKPGDYKYANPWKLLIDFYVITLFPHCHSQGFWKNRFWWIHVWLQPPVFLTWMR